MAARLFVTPVSPTILALVCWFLVGGSCTAYEEPYCGLYAVHAALHSFGISSSFDALVVPDNLSGPVGSSAADLIRIAEAHGAYGSLESGMSIANLRAADTPIILHTSVAISKGAFHHWVLLLGMEGDSARIYDPPRSMYLTPAAELLSYWDGRGVVIGKSAPAGWRSPVTLEAVLAVLLVVACLGFFSRSGLLKPYPAGRIVAAALAAATVWHAVVTYGFFRSPHATANIVSHYEAFAVGEETIESIQTAIAGKDATILDARRPDAYDRWHIPTALNLPVTATHGELREVLESIPKDRKLIVYCNSSQCSWARQVAHHIAARGYRNVSVFTDGVEGWMAALPGASTHATSSDTTP
jgi:rhodanese-related sulfurtransferase